MNKFVAKIINPKSNFKGLKLPIIKFYNPHHVFVKFKNKELSFGLHEVAISVK